MCVNVYVVRSAYIGILYQEPKIYIRQNIYNEEWLDLLFWWTKQPALQQHCAVKQATLYIHTSSSLRTIHSHMEAKAESKRGDCQAACNSFKILIKSVGQNCSNATDVWYCRCSGWTLVLCRILFHVSFYVREYYVFTLRFRYIHYFCRLSRGTACVLVLWIGITYTSQ